MLALLGSDSTVPFGAFGLKPAATSACGIKTGDGLDGYDSPERAAIGKIYALVDQHFFNLAKSERQT